MVKKLAALTILFFSHVLTLSHAFASCDVGLRVEFAKYETLNGELSPLPVKRVELIQAAATMTAYTLVDGNRSDTPATRMNIDDGSVSMTIPVCNETTRFKLFMGLKKTVDTAYFVVYRPVFTINGNERAFSWSTPMEYGGPDSWNLDRNLFLFEQGRP